jgi:hypothetical protein
MTLIIGVGCEEGSVLLCDSLTRKRQADGSWMYLRTHELKIGVLERAGLAYVAAGMLRADEFQDFEASDFVAASRRLFARFSAAVVPELAYAAVEPGARLYDGSIATPEQVERELANDRKHAVIAAELGTGRLGMLSDDGEQWGPGVYVTGAAGTWWSQQRKPPTPEKLWYCHVLAARIAAAFLWCCYHEDNYLADQDIGSAWSISPVMAPFHGVTVSPEGARLWHQWI